MTAAGAIVVAAGRGERFGGALPKALMPLAGAPLVRYAVTMLRRVDGLRCVVVSAPPDRLDEVRALVAGEPEVVVVAGGATRRDSVAAALAALDPSVDVVLVHDAARPLTPVDVAERVLAAVRGGADAVIPVVAVTDTVKTVDRDRLVVRTVDRSSLAAVQTPQGFRRDLLTRAHAAGDADATDDASLVERLGVPVLTVPGSADAFKVTTQEDLERAEALLAHRGERVL
jgi:2-C-methyl-D-erythritol 4-phosphate cytidylyltransferase